MGLAKWLSIGSTNLLHHRVGAGLNLIPESRFCCKWMNFVEGVAKAVFTEQPSQFVHIVELGVDQGLTAQFLLGRYDWIRWVGVDKNDRTLKYTKRILADHASRVRVWVPMNTSDALRAVSLERFQFDVVILDAR